MRTLKLLTVMAAATALTGCYSDGYGYDDGYYGPPPGYYRSGYEGPGCGPGCGASYNVWYDGYYGPFDGGYWGPDGSSFYFYDGRRYDRDDGIHFRHGWHEGFHRYRSRRWDWR